jgi:hypothetical protein
MAPVDDAFGLAFMARHGGRLYQFDPGPDPQGGKKTLLQQINECPLLLHLVEEDRLIDST